MTGLFSRINVLCVVLGAGLLVAGCGTDDVELNGKIFDAVGLSGSQKSKGDEPKVAARSGIVVPPTLARCPSRAPAVRSRRRPIWRLSTIPTAKAGRPG